MTACLRVKNGIACSGWLLATPYVSLQLICSHASSLDLQLVTQLPVSPFSRDLFRDSFAPSVPSMDSVARAAQQQALHGQVVTHKHTHLHTRTLTPSSFHAGLLAYYK